jgi:hypothetical protein
MRELRRVLDLAPTERRLFLEAALLLSLCRPALALFGIQRLRRVCDRFAPSHRAGGTAESVQPESVARAVVRAARAVPGSTCLTRAITIQFLLSRAGHEARLRIGVSKAGSAPLLAHAWVECCGAVVGGDDVDLYAPLRQVPLG